VGCPKGGQQSEHKVNYTLFMSTLLYIYYRKRARSELPGRKPTLPWPAYSLPEACQPWAGADTANASRIFADTVNTTTVAHRPQVAGKRWREEGSVCPSWPPWSGFQHFMQVDCLD